MEKIYGMHRLVGLQLFLSGTPTFSSGTPTFSSGTPTFCQMGVLNSCFQNPSESSGPPSCSPGNLFTILLQLTKSQRLLAVIVFEISLLEVFDVHFAKGINSKNAKVIWKKYIFVCCCFLFSPGNLLITLYQLSIFGVPSCNVFLRYQVNFLCQNLQRAITKKNVVF